MPLYKFIADNGILDIYSYDYESESDEYDTDDELEQMSLKNEALRKLNELKLIDHTITCFHAFVNQAGHFTVYLSYRAETQKYDREYNICRYTMSNTKVTPKVELTVGYIYKLTPLQLIKDRLHHIFYNLNPQGYTCALQNTQDRHAIEFLEYMSKCQRIHQSILNTNRSSICISLSNFLCRDVARLILSYI
jgi:hypothetical protein